MCNYKAIVSDLDGTLFDADSRISPRTAAALRAAACGPPCPLPAKDSPSPILGKGEILAYLQQIE